MFISRLLKSKIASLLSPWLDEELELELHMGFLKWVATAKNLVFSSSSLNPLIENSTRLHFRWVKFGEIGLKVSHWGFPFLVVDVKNVDVILNISLSEVVKESSCFRDFGAKKRKEAIAVLDPEGALLHEIIEKVLTKASSGNRLVTRLANSMLRCCKIQFTKISVQLQFVDDTHVCALKIDHFYLHPHSCNESSLFRNLVGLHLTSNEDSSITINCSSIEFELKENDHTSRIISIMGTSIYVRLNQFQPLEYSAEIPNVFLNIPPGKIPIFIVLLDSLSLKATFKEKRSGQELWKIVAEKVDPWLVGSTISFYKAAYTVLMWSRYVHAYKSLLSAIGFYAYKKSVEETVMVSVNRKQLRYVKQQWILVNELEKKLPVEAVGCARQIARHQNLSHVDLPKSNSSAINLMNLFVHLLLVLWKAICFIFLVNNSSSVVSKDSEVHFNLCLGEVNITMPHTNQAIVKKKVSDASNTRDIKYTSFCFIMRGFLLECTSLIVITSFFAGLKELEVCLSSLRRDQSKTKVPELEADDKSDLILWGDPAILHHSPEESAGTSFSNVDKGLTHVLQKSIRDLGSYWDNIVIKYDKLDTPEKKIPFILCEQKIFLIDPYTKGGCHGFSMCNLAIGKLNIILENSSLLFITMLIHELHQYSQLINKVEAEHGILNSSVLVESSQIAGVNKLLFWIHRIKEIILNTIPNKKIELGAFIAGPKICLSSQIFNSLTAEEIDNFCFAFDMENFEFAVWSASRSIVGELMDEGDLNEGALEYDWLKEPRILNIRNKQTNGEFYHCEGRIPLNVCMRVNNLTVVLHDLESTEHSQILEPLSLMLQLSICRDYLHSISVAANTVSMAMNALSTDVVLYLYMDEIWAFLQIFKGIFFIELPSGNSLEFITPGDSEDPIRKLMTNTIRNPERNMDVPISVLKTKIINIDAQIVVDASLELEAVYVILNDTRRNFLSQSLICPDRASSSTTSYIDKSSSRKKYKNIELFDLPEFGIGLFLKKCSTEVIGECNHLDVIMHHSQIRSVIFNRKSALEACIGTSQIDYFLVTSSECLNQFILSASIFSIHIGSHDVTLSSSISIDKEEYFDFDASHHNSEFNCPNHVLNTCQSVSISTLETAEGSSLLFGIQLGKISVYENYMKSVDGDHQANNLEIFVKICKELQSANCNVQGGNLYLEPSALAVFANCLESYFLLISTHPLLLQYNSKKLLSEADFTVEMTDNFPIVGYASNSLPESGIRNNNLVSLQVVTVNISRFSITLGGKKTCEGEIEELILEFDLRLKSLDSGNKLFLDLEHITFSAQYLHTCILTESAISVIPHFLSNTEDHEFTSSATSKREKLVEKTASESALYVSYILEQMTASFAIEKLFSDSTVDTVLPVSSDWVGSGSVYGAEFRMTLNDIQMISSLFSPFSGISSGKGAQKPKQFVRSRIQERNTDSNHIIPDGAVVAIKDLHEHMYFAVESIAEKYHVVGVLHYSLVGKRSLFRVKYHKGWWSQESQVYLTSLFAKNKRGEPLRLNFTSGSGFVEISSSDDKKQALWQILPYRSNSSEDDDDPNSYFLNKTFHLVNQKNNCSVAFIDGLPEFVKKPGNPVKIKVFNEFPLTRNMRMNDCNGSSDATCVTENVLPHVNISVSKVSLTIFHDNSDANGKLPFFRGSINDISIISQIISSKFRIISSFCVAIQYMDAPRNLWMDILSPVGSTLFFHSKFVNLDASSVYEGIPAHLFFGMRQVDISLTEVSVDILLYLIGKLNIAGPFAVRTTNIFTNFCKLKNNSGLNLICRFPGNEDVKLAPRQSASVFLRQLATTDRLQDRGSLASISLSEEGKFSTSPINILLSKSSYFAWRTRAVSLKDSRSFPGPFIVTEVAKKSEEGLCISASPLVKISNESGLSMEFRFDRPQDTGEYAAILLQSGDVIDDSVAVFDALQLSGGSRKALMSLTLGNFKLFVKPDINKFVGNKESVSADWSEVLQGGKAQRLSGIFDKLNYKLKKAFGSESVKSFFGTLSCPIIVDGRQVSCLYILVQTIVRDVPVIQPPNPSDNYNFGSSPVAMQLQKEIFLYPTVQVYNLLQTEIFVHVTENHPGLSVAGQSNDIGNCATVPCDSSAVLYANPASMHISVTLTTYSSKCKPVNSSDWVKKLNKQNSVLQHMDIELDFGGGKYFASLRLTRAEKGHLEAIIFSSYTFQNNTEFPLFIASSNQKPLPWEELSKYSSNTPPEKGCLLPPNSKGSWFSKSGKVQLKQLEEKTSMSLLDLDMLSGFSEVCLTGQDEIGISRLTKLGVSLQPCAWNPHIPSQVVCIVSRFVFANETKMPIFIRQCYLQEDLGEVIQVDGKQKKSLHIRSITRKHQNRSIIDSVFKRHKNLDDNSQAFFQFSLKDDRYGWSGPICIASLGRFFLKFKRSSVDISDQSDNSKFALIHVIEESSSLVLHFYMPENVAPPYRIENYLRGSSVIYHQKDSTDSGMLRSGDSVGYVWDDLNLPHKLVVEVPELHLMREINIDKISSWKPLFKMRQGMVMNLPQNKGYGKEKETLDICGPDIFKVGYEIYADGPTRVLRFCETADRYKEEKVVRPSIGIRFVVSSFTVNLLEKEKQDADSSESQVLSTIIVVRLANIFLNFLVTDRFKYYQFGVQSLSVDEKWNGAPFASMIRRSRLHDYGSNDNILDISVILNSTNFSAKEVKRSSIILQPIDLKIDEETLMRLVPFWRASLSTSKTPSQQFFFKNFEIHPIKITASYLPGNPYASYSSAQEALRTLLHSVIKVPAVNNKVIELNGILLTHAFVTFRELIIKCAQHYSWYIVRAIYIAKGSPLLPPAFASIFDDTASSSLDIFFDPSDGSISLPGVSLGMFKFISKCISSKGSFGTKRYFGDLGKTIKTAGSNALFAAVTEVSDSILRGAEVDGFKGMVNGFHHGIMRLAMEPAFLGAAVLEGGSDRKILLDRSPGVDELYIEGYLQAMLDVMYMQEYLRVRVIDNQVILKNLPPNSSVINDIVESVKSFLVSKALLKSDPSMTSRPLRHLRAESEWRFGPTVLTLCEHLFVSFTIRILRKQADKYTYGKVLKWNDKNEQVSPSSSGTGQEKFSLQWTVGKFVFSGIIAYLDGRLCRNIPNPIARRIVSGFLLSYIDNKERQ